MNIHLNEYLAIYKAFPIGNYFSKEQRKTRHTMMTNWENSRLQERPTLDELINFIRQYKDEIKITPQFFKKFEAVWLDDVKNGYQFAEFLLEMDFAELMWRFDISSMDLAEQVLQHNPNHKKALELKLQILVRYHDFNVHELPYGVLVDGNLEEELKSVQEMEGLAKKINLTNKSFEILVANCKTYYPLWFEYLQEKEKNGFESFLIAKGIDVDNIETPYVIISNKF